MAAPAELSTEAQDACKLVLATVRRHLLKLSAADRVAAYDFLEDYFCTTRMQAVVLKRLAEDVDT
jgi:hypothetical protein